MKGQYKALAQRFIPEKVLYLLIRESPPYTPPDEKLRYIYNYGNSKGGEILLSNLSYSFLGERFYTGQDTKELFLRKLMQKGLFLIDATYEPINRIKDKKVRLRKIIDAYPHLKENIAKLPVDEHTNILLIHGNVIKTIGKRIRYDFKNNQIYDIGFPSCYNDQRFKRKLKIGVVEPRLGQEEGRL